MRGSVPRDDLIPNSSVNTSLRLRAPPLSFPRIFHPEDPSSASFDEVSNAANQQEEHPTSVPSYIYMYIYILLLSNILSPILFPAKCGPPNTHPRYLRISADSFAIPVADWEGVDAGSNEGPAKGTTAGGRQDTVGRTVQKRGVNNGTPSLSHGAPAIRSSKPTE